MPATAANEETFKHYSEEQAKYYARHRHDYSPALYNAVLAFHASTGGRHGVLLDVGCGAGNVTRALAPHFQRAVGIDPSPAMVRQARDVSTACGALTRAGAPLSFCESAAEMLSSSSSSSAEELRQDAGIEQGSVDLITVANAGHWFDDMPAFWRAARSVLRPRSSGGGGGGGGGTVALWTPGEGGRFHPSTPGAEALQDLLRRFIERDLLPYYAPGNFLVRDRYRDLVLPWAARPPVQGFVEEDFERREWRDVGEEEEEEEEEEDTRMVSMDVFEAAVDTMSPVTRWRAAHPDVAGTEEDVVKVLRREMEAVMRAHGVEAGEERVRMAMDGVLLLVKRSG